MNNLLETQIKGVLENTVFNRIISLNLNIPSPILRAIVSRVAETSAVELVKNVSLASNKQLNTIPTNAVGPINPVNITNANNGPVEIASNIDGIIQQQLLMQTVDKIVSQVTKQLKLTLPTDKLGIINFNALADSVVQSLTPAVSKNITSAVGGFANSVFGRGQTTKLTVPGISQFFGGNDSATAMTKINEQFNTNLASTALAEAKTFDVNNDANKEKLEVVSKGFTDPSANYPTKEYSGISETNKLAQGDIKGTVVQIKNDERMKGAKLPGGDAWDEPESAFRGAYPYNKVSQTESGHIIEIDDTPGSERLHIYHKSGTYVEIDANGSMVKRTKGSSYEIIDRNGKIAIAGRADISINGACNIFVGNDANIEVEGDVNLTCHNDITAQAGGTFNLSAVEEFNIASGNVNIEAYYTMNQKSTTMNMHSKENMHIRSNADIKLQATNLFDFVTDTIYTQAAGAINLKSGSNTNIDSGAKIDLLASAKINLDGSEIHLKSGNAGAASESAESVIAGSSNIGVIAGRKDVQDNVINDPLTLSLADSRSIDLEEETESGNYQAQKNVLISEGFATAADIAAAPVAIDSETPQSAQTDSVTPDINLKKVTELPGNYNLSPNFTVEMLSSKAAVTRDFITSSESLKYGDIVYNLQAVALNVLEPFKKLYPNMFVTSAYRSPKNASNASKSQHPSGCGVDIQFKGATKAEYYNIAIQLAKVLQYDQMILEFCNYTKNPWIHVSFTVQKNRLQVMTFNNHAKYSDGLTQLA